MAVLDALRRGEPYKRWLVIFDNANEPEDINDLIPRGPGHALVTSRSHRWNGGSSTHFPSTCSAARRACSLSLGA